MTESTCTVETCDAPKHGRVYCVKHYRRWKKYGDPLGSAPVVEAPPPDTCSIEGCDKPVRIKSRGWCSPHYSRWRDHGDPLGGGPDRPLVPQSTRPCTVDGCSESAKTKGLCGRHYYREYTHGDPVLGRTPEGAALAHFEANLDTDTDECMIWPFQRMKSGHGRIRIEGQSMLLMTLVCERTYGPPPSAAHTACHPQGHDPGCWNPRHITWGLGDRFHRVRAARPVCIIDGCTAPVKTLVSGWCSRHYQRAKAHGGEPLAGRSANGEALAYLSANLHVVTEGCRIWPFGTSVNATGRRYGRVWLDGRYQSVHVLVCEALYGPRPGPVREFDACHNCGVSLCWSAGHLRWDTHQANMDDQIAHGTRNWGERNGHARLTEDEAVNIRGRYGRGVQIAELAAEFSISESHVRAIGRGEKWRYLDA
jgi:HNH endonuclease